MFYKMDNTKYALQTNWFDDILRLVRKTILLWNCSCLFRIPLTVPKLIIPHIRHFLLSENTSLAALVGIFFCSMQREKFGDDGE